MTLKLDDNLTPDVRALQLQIADISRWVQGPGGIYEQLSANQQSIQSLLTTRTTTPPSPVANLLYNGELGHSNFTWFEVTGTPTGDKNEECAYWFSHNVPARDTTLNRIFVDVSVDTGTEEITLNGHGFTTGTPVDLLNFGGALPTGLAAGTVYFVIRVDVNTIQLAATRADAFASPVVPVNITAAAGSGFHYVQAQLIATSSSSGSPSATNNTLKTPSHSAYVTSWGHHYSRWDAVNGWAELTGTMSVDALLPANLIDATTPLARIGLIAAKKNSYIEIPDATIMGAGIWDNTSATAAYGGDYGRRFLPGTITLTAETVGTPGATTRSYKILYASDRGFSVLSDEVTLTDTPADGAFTSTNNVVLSWPLQAGQLQVDIYEYYAAGAQYRLLAQISSGATSYIHLGSFIDTPSGYPTPTDNTSLTATFYTREGEMAGLATNGGPWDTIIFPISVPANYDKAITTDRQWLRLWMDTACNLYIPGCSTTSGDATVTIPDGAIDSSALASGGYGTGGVGASKYYGLDVEIYDAAGTLISTHTISSITSDTEFELGTTASSTLAGTATIRIVGGGFHGVLIDKIHLGYQANTSYTPNANDFRTLQPRAAPASSTQGGVGSGDGDGGGGISCIATGTPVKMSLGIWKEVQTTRPGQMWASAGLKPNVLTKLRESMGNVRRVRTANGCVVECTFTERFVTDELDIKGTPLAHLRIGDYVLTEVNDRIEKSPIVEISEHLGRVHVYTPTLSDNHLFIAGRIKLTFWQRIMAWLTRRKCVRGGFVLHNLKGEYLPLDLP